MYIYTMCIYIYICIVFMCQSNKPLNPGISWKTPCSFYKLLQICGTWVRCTRLSYSRIISAGILSHGSGWGQATPKHHSQSIVLSLVFLERKINNDSGTTQLNCDYRLPATVERSVALWDRERYSFVPNLLINLNYRNNMKQPQVFSSIQSFLSA